MDAAAAAATVREFRGSERLMGDGEEGTCFFRRPFWLWAERMGVPPLVGITGVVVVLALLIESSGSQAPEFNLGSSGWEREKRKKG